ncbi:hypothetical protein TNCT_442761 [Trichonephila clavata]|uniref:Uncharacterized protein n=1 Tax=Trichonephila clavata TaxID=2740835 RepID=A0A8X6LD21_TRICU|nr:hypothetical protein TNCT_442761 [Trichonephila clavata]
MHIAYVSQKSDKLQQRLNHFACDTYGINSNVHTLIYKHTHVLCPSLSMVQEFRAQLLTRSALSFYGISRDVFYCVSSMGIVLLVLNQFLQFLTSLP